MQPHNTVKYSRDITIDIMRSIGIFVIIIAHSEPPGWILQLRNFGTPLLVVASALSFAAAYSTGIKDISKFYKKRLLNLTLPCWIFLTFFFAFYAVLYFLLDQKLPFDFKTMITSYTFYSGIGFLWIIQIYLLIALFVPLAIYISRTINSNSYFYLLLLACYIGYEFLTSLSTWEYPYQLSITLTFFNAVAYILIFLYGIRLHKLTTLTIVVVSCICLVFFLILAIYLKTETGEFTSTQTFKYPPRLYYLSYAFLAINVIYLIGRLNILKLFTPLFSWISINSLWIYLWHIFFFYSWFYFFNSVGGGYFLSAAMAIYILTASFGATYLQTKFVTFCESRTKSTFLLSAYKYLH